MELQKPSIVIFDMDGTTVRHLNPHLLGVMEFLDDCVFKVSRLWTWVFERKAQGPLLLTPPKKPAKSIIVHKAIHKLRRKPVDLLVEPCPGIYSVLSFLKKQGIPMALVSNGLGKGYGDDIVKKNSALVNISPSPFSARISANPNPTRSRSSWRSAN